MRYCEGHIDRIMGEIGERGLAALACDPDDEATIEHKIADAATNGLTFDNFDPLGCVLFLVGNACMARFGTEAWELLVPRELGMEQCPLCYFDANCNLCPDHERLITRAADLMVGFYHRLSIDT